MRYARLLSWTLFVIVFLIYLTAIKLVRGNQWQQTHQQQFIQQVAPLYTFQQPYNFQHAQLQTQSFLAHPQQQQQQQHQQSHAAKEARELSDGNSGIAHHVTFDSDQQQLQQPQELQAKHQQPVTRRHQVPLPAQTSPNVVHPHTQYSAQNKPPLDQSQVGRPSGPTAGRPPATIEFAYHNYAAMTNLLHNISNNFPELVRVYTIGKSVQGRQLWVALVTKDPHNDDQLLKPNVKYVANMHGNEHGDGRGNANGFDLNRNFPDFFAANNFDPAKEQPETRAVRLWIDQIPFVLSANLHGGALVASYPFDNQQGSFLTARRPTSQHSPTPDDDVFKHLAQVYSFSHETMYQGQPCPWDSKGFPNGTTNGAKWYLLEVRNQKKDPNVQQDKSSPAQLRAAKDIQGLDLENSVKIIQPEPADVMNYKIIIKPDEGFYKKG
ncbi:carboxypeptidase M, partial [Olea europaea subsp. europaea]